MAARDRFDSCYGSLPSDWLLRSQAVMTLAQNLRVEYRMVLILSQLMRCE
jgi:hypothetical protein